MSGSITPPPGFTLNPAPKPPPGFRGEPDDDRRRAKKKPAAKDEDLPWDVPYTSEQLRKAREQIRIGEEKIAVNEPEPGLEHLLTGPLRAAQRGGQQLFSERPLPTGIEALEEAGLGLRPSKFTSAARPTGIAPRIEPTVPGGPRPGAPTPPPGFALEEAGITPTPEPRPGPPAAARPGTPLAEAGITPTPEPAAPVPAAETETVAVPQADGTVKQVQVHSGEPPPPPGEPPAPPPTEPPVAPMNPADLRAGFPELSDEQFEALFQQAAREVPRPTSVDPADQNTWMQSVMGAMTRLSASAAVPGQQPAETGTSRPSDPWAPVADAPADQPQAETPAAPELSTATPTAMAPSAPIEAHGGPWTPVLDKDGAPATNPQGVPLFENANGVRSIMEDGVPYTERTKEHPEKGLMPHDVVNRKGQFLTKDEAGRTETAPPKKSESEGPAPQKQRADGTVEPGEPRKPKAAAKKDETEDWKATGEENEEGDPIYANDQGVHSIMKDGVRIIEKVRMRETESGMEMSVPPPGEKEPAFRPAAKPVEEKPRAETAKEPAPAAEPKPEAPKPKPSADALHDEIVGRMKQDKTLAAHLTTADEDPDGAVETLKSAYAKAGVEFLKELMAGGDAADWAPFFNQPRAVDRAVLDEVLGRAPKPAAKPKAEKPAPAVIPPGDEYFAPIASGEKLRSQSGRELSPAPTFAVDTDRRANIGRAKMNDWLLTEARKEAEATGDTHVAGMLEGLDPKNFSQSDRDTVTDILFGDPEGPKPEHRLKDVPQKETSAPSPSPTGLGELGDAGKAIGENLRDMLWERAQSGRTESAGAPDNLLILAKSVRNAGGLKDRAAFDKFITRVAPLLEDRTEGWQDRLRQAGQEFVPTPSTEAKPEAPKAEEKPAPDEAGKTRGGSTILKPKSQIATGNPPTTQLIAPSQTPTSEADGTGTGTGSGPGDGSLDQPGGGEVRTPRPGSRSGGRKPGNKGLAHQPTADVSAPETAGDPGEDGVRPEPEPPGSDQPVSDGGDAADGRPGTGDSGVDDAGTGADPGPIEPSAANSRPNFYISDPEAMVGGGDKQRFNRNRRAIEAFQNIQDEGRQPTDEELTTMAGFTGWGSFGQDLFQGTFDRPVQRPDWNTEGQWLREHLGQEAWRAAQASIENAHYTDPPTVNAMWNMVRQMGFKGGRVLEPSMGIGNFFGLMPRDVMDRSTLTGIELEPTTGGMAKLLYPQAAVFIKGYQESQTSDNFYDLVIGNWPFSAVPPADRRYNRLNPTLHDFFYLKALDQTRPGGLVVGITSTGTMDKMDRLVRMELAKKGELIAAFRLPSGAFEKYAGTKVVTDIIILRKRTEPLTDAAAEQWIETKPMDTPSGEQIRVNQYYHDHPQNVLGTLDFGHGTTQYRPGMIVHRPADLMERLQFLPAKLPVDAYAPVVRGKEPRFITNNTTDRNKSVVVGDDGHLYQVAGERLLRLDDVHKGMLAGSAKIQKEKTDQIKDLVAMRKAYGALIDAERDAAPATPMLRETLHDLYHRYIKGAPGKLTDTPGMKVLARVDDPNWPILAALQRPDGEPAAILSGPVVRSRRVTGNPTVSDAYVMTRNESVILDMPRIAELAKQPVEQVINHLEEAGAVYRTPGGGYEPSDSYLSGNVRRKFKEAVDAVERGEPMERSVEALRKVIPPNTPYYEIEAKFGAPWVSDKDYQRFIAEHLLDLPENRWRDVHVEFTGGRWHVAMPHTLTDSVEATQTHGHPRYRFDRMLTAALGNVTPRIMDPKDRDGGPYYNEQASEEVATRIQEIREKFQDWAWADAERTLRLEDAFNDAMNAVAKPHFDGSFMDMAGMALQRGDDPFSLRQHQLAAIWRGVVLGRGLFAHEVGTGKTYTIGGIAIEGRRYGKWNKPLVLAHNANSRAVANEVQQMYPGAKILYLDSDDLTAATLKATMYQIRNEDWDMVVMQHSHLKKLALKRETLMGLAREQITAMEDELYAAAAEDDVDLSKVNLNDEKDIEKKIRSATAKNLAKQRLKILNTIEAQAQRASSPDAIPFEDLGVDAIFVDEAHIFKKPPISTRMKVKGLNTEASTISIGLDFLTKYVKNNNNGNGVFLFTGTPVTNSLNEIFNMSKYFMDDVMKRDGIGDWDTWFNTFADALNDVELVSTGDYEQIRRLSSFVNVDELVRVMSQYTDVVQAKDMPEFVDRATQGGGNAGGKTLSSPDLTAEERDWLENGRTENPVGRPYKRVINDVGEILPDQAIIQDELRAEMRAFKAASPRYRKENRHIPVVIEGDLSRASLDARMFEPTAEEHPNNKINRVTKNVLEIYATPKTAQMIFVDNGYNPSKKNPAFAVVPALIDKLVKGGIPRKEIALVAGNLNPEQKAEIARKMNNGEIRIAIGQSNTLGVGVNAQVNLRAMHHMDAPWMPGELEQRNGRGHRQGNSWNTVLEYRYITEGLDGKRWQVLTIKDRFIKQFISAFNDESGKRIGVIEGDAADISEKEDIMGTLSAAAGDPRLLQKEKLKADVNRLERRERTHRQGVADAQRRARMLAENIVARDRALERAQKPLAAWDEAHARMEVAAQEAGSKNRWYDATIDGQPLRTTADIQAALDKQVLLLAQGEGEVRMGTINGLGITAEWRKGQSEPYYHLIDDRGDTVGETMKGLTMPRILGQITKARNYLDAIPERNTLDAEDIAKLEKAANQPFTQAVPLLKKRQQLAQLEDDLQENPIPPPAWLRHGAPIDTPIWVDGQERVVRGHRMKDDYYILTDEGDVPYMRVTDQNGFNTFVLHPPPPAPMPKDLPAWAPPMIAKVPGAQVIWHRGDLVLIRTEQDGDEVFLGFKKGLTEDQQAWNVFGMRGAFDVKDIDKMRQEATSWIERERNRKALEQANAPKDRPPAPVSETPWVGLDAGVDPVTRRLIAEREAAQTARARELAAKWIRRQTPGKPN